MEARIVAATIHEIEKLKKEKLLLRDQIYAHLRRVDGAQSLMLPAWNHPAPQDICCWQGFSLPGRPKMKSPSGAADYAKLV